MNERPIIFSGPMVRAILEGRKTQTRRLVRPQPDNRLKVARRLLNAGHENIGAVFSERDGDLSGQLASSAICPYGAPGTRLWVRETWGCAHYEGIDAAPNYFYRADETDPEHDALIRWRPSIHMPRTASRITREITDVRVERLQQISEDDARAEGVGEGPQEGMVTGPVVAFADLWGSIHGPDAWLKNPWVWVVEFRRIDAAARPHRP